MLGLLIGLLVGLLLGFLIGNFVNSLACPHMPLLTFLELIGLIIGQLVGFLGPLNGKVDMLMVILVSSTHQMHAS